MSLYVTDEEVKFSCRDVERDVESIRTLLFYRVYNRKIFFS